MSENINQLNCQEILDFILKNIHANVFLIKKNKMFKETDIGTIVIPDYEDMVGYTITNDTDLLEYQEKVKKIDELIYDSEYESYNTNEKCFLIYLICFIFLFPDIPIVLYITSIINLYYKNQITYYQIIFKDIITRMGLIQNIEIIKITNKFDFKTETADENINGGSHNNQKIKFKVIIILCFLFSVSFSAITFAKLPKNIINNYESDLKNLIIKSNIITTNLNSLTKKQETVIIHNLNKNIKSHIKSLTKPESLNNKIFDFINNTLDTLKIINVFDSNNKLFSFIVDSKKVGNNLKDILNNEFKFTFKNSIILLGNISKLALYAGSCLNKNFVLVLESTSALGSFTNTLSSTILLYDLNKHVLNTAYSFSKSQRNEIMTGDLDIGSSAVFSENALTNLYKIVDKYNKSIDMENLEGGFKQNKSRKNKNKQKSRQIKTKCKYK
jgi:hypothetical protein